MSSFVLALVGVLVDAGAGWLYFKRDLSGPVIMLGLVAGACCTIAAWQAYRALHAWKLSNRQLTGVGWARAGAVLGIVGAVAGFAPLVFALLAVLLFIGMWFVFLVAGGFVFGGTGGG